MIWSNLSTIILRENNPTCYNLGMNLKSFDKSTRILKQADLTTHGLVLQGNPNATLIGIIDCTQNGTAPLIQNLISGIHQAGGVAMTFNINNFNFLQRLSPATAKYATNYRDAIATQTAGIIRTQMLDGVVAVVDNYVMGLGVLIGCTNTNCPVLLMPVGMIANYDRTLLNASGNIATRTLKAGDVESARNRHTLFGHLNGRLLSFSGSI